MATEEVVLTPEQKTDAVREYARQCNGSEHMHQHWTNRILYTDGVKFVAETCGAHWLIDLIASHQHEAKVKRESFQVWKLGYCGEGYSAMCTDGNDIVVTEQAMEYMDFPQGLLPFSLWLEHGTLMLPQER